MYDNALYFCQTLDIPEFYKLGLLKQCWHSGEWLYQGDIPKKSLTFPSEDEIFQDLENYLKGQKFEVEPESIPEWDADYDNQLENFVKFVWLTREYLTSGFRNPLGVHYNPRLYKNVIHPGGCRQQVIKLFHFNDVNAFYFNTGGVQPSWLANMVPCDLENLTSNGWDINIVADHASLIPHLLKDLEGIKTGKLSTQKIITERIGSIKIKSNHKLDILRPWQTKNSKKANWFLEFYSGTLKENLVKSFSCILNDHNFLDHQISVRKKQ